MLNPLHPCCNLFLVTGDVYVPSCCGRIVNPATTAYVQVLTLLNESRANFEVVNVLDEIHNPGLRETIKTYSQWPTIPQVCKILPRNCAEPGECR